MASTISNAALTVTISENITLNGSQQGATNTFTTDTTINEISKRIVSVPTAKVEILKFDTNVASGTFVESNVRYIRITNKDNANHVCLTFKNENNDEFIVLLDKGQSFIYNSNLDGGVVNTFDATASTGADINNLGDLVNISAQADTAAVDLELFVASI